MINVGAAITDITPPAGLTMAGFAARTDVATGAHDQLTARALVVENTALVTADVIGIDSTVSQKIRSRCSLPDYAVTITATHTHGGPASMPGRLWSVTDPEFLCRLENGIVHAIDLAVAARKPARLFGGTGICPGHARNRRQQNGSVDRNIPVLRFDDVNGVTIAILASYACHPVVLGADNLRWTGDYPHYVREALEANYPGAVALFATGCAGDVNTGHTAAQSLSNESNPERTFSMARIIGQNVARSADRAELSEITGKAGCAQIREDLSFELRESGTPERLAGQWRHQSGTGDTSGDDAVAHIWADWAEQKMGRDIGPLSVRCTAMNWCGAQVVALPGEIFAKTALEIRQSLSGYAPLFVLSYADDNPGYVPHRDAYSDGGYEVEEAHRFYGLGATFAPGSAERLADAGCKAARMAARVAEDNC